MKQISNLIEDTNAHLESLAAGLGVLLNIKTIFDTGGCKQKTTAENGKHVITLNATIISESEYESHAGYFVRKVLLPQLKLETERLLLRRYDPEDAEQCLAFLSNEQDAYMDCSKAFHEMDTEYQELMDLFAQRESQYMITLKESGEVIGTINVFADASRAVDSMEIGYSIAHAHQRKGYAYEALSALLGLLQNDLCLEMVTAGVLPENVASEKLLRKLGFYEEGLRHKAVWHEGLNKPVDLIYYYRDRQEKYYDR